MIKIIKSLPRLIKQRLRPQRYFSLNELDRKLEKYVDFDNGYYVELGANDGISQSNSLYFERHRGWRGVLVEPVLHNFMACRRNRSEKNSIYCAACVSFDYHEDFVRIAYSNLMTTPLSLVSDIANPREHAVLGRQFLRQEEEVVEFGAIAKPLNSLLLEANAPAIIDFLSLDVEGAELEVLQGIDHQVFCFKYILVECRDLSRLRLYLEEKGYSLIDKFSEHDYLFAAQEKSLDKE